MGDDRHHAALDLLVWNLVLGEGEVRADAGDCVSVVGNLVEVVFAHARLEREVVLVRPARRLEPISDRNELDVECTGCLGGGVCHLGVDSDRQIFRIKGRLAVPVLEQAVPTQSPKVRKSKRESEWGIRWTERAKKSTKEEHRRRKDECCRKNRRRLYIIFS